MACKALMYIYQTLQSFSTFSLLKSVPLIYSCALIKAWVEKNYSNITTTILPLGIDGTNPSNFEATFDWWRKTWTKDIAPSPDLEIWLGLKGGVGQTS
jgi:hypothetical protein